MAFHDRWHAHLPGWEMPKMQLAYFTSHMGFIADSEQARAELRWSSSIPLTDGCGCRDQGVGAETGLVGDAVLKRLRQRTFIDGPPRAVLMRIASRRIIQISRIVRQRYM
jgi:hypothetical protein